MEGGAVMYFGRCVDVCICMRDTCVYMCDVFCFRSGWAIAN